MYTTLTITNSTYSIQWISHKNLNYSLLQKELIYELKLTQNQKHKGR